MTNLIAVVAVKDNSVKSPYDSNNISHVNVSHRLLLLLST